MYSLDGYWYVNIVKATQHDVLYQKKKKKKKAFYFTKLNLYVKRIRQHAYTLFYSIYFQ